MENVYLHIRIIIHKNLKDVPLKVSEKRILTLRFFFRGTFNKNVIIIINKHQSGVPLLVFSLPATAPSQLINLLPSKCNKTIC